MVTKLTNSSLDDDSRFGIDAWIKDIPIALRVRSISIDAWGEISIRSYSHGYKCELDKLLDGSFKPGIYIFRFNDALLICPTVDILERIKISDYHIIENKDDTAGIYIPIANIKRKLIIRDLKQFCLKEQ